MQEVCGRVYETYYVRLFLQLDSVPVPYYTTPEVCFNEKHTDVQHNQFIHPSHQDQKIVGIDASGFKSSEVSPYYTNEEGIRKRYIKGMHAK